VTRVATENPFALHEGAAETWAFIEQRVLENGLVDRGLKELCLMYIAEPDSAVGEERDGRERAALEWAHAIVWDADAATDELWTRLHEQFSEQELVELGCAIGFELGRQHFLRSLGADPARVRASQLR
jgi:alkylhydroperoxidase family enzyme